MDGVKKLQAWIVQGATDYTINLPIPAGNHTIRLDYFEEGQDAVAKLSWKSAGPATFWALDITNDSAPMQDSGADLTKIERYSRSDGPCYGKSAGTCRLGTRAVYVNASGSMVESMTHE